MNTLVEGRAGTAAAPGSGLRRFLPGRARRRAIVSLIVFLALWELGSRSKEWFGVAVPWIGHVPAPSGALRVWAGLLHDPGYWQSWGVSLLRVIGGFSVAMWVSIPFGLALASSRWFHQMAFPVFEVLRPIPPLAWVPAAIIFWPTPELSIGFVTFIGAFFTIVINVVGGARSIDARYFQAARAMGASRWNLFRRIVLPATLPSIAVGASVGMGITWEVVVAAEMISGGGNSGAAGGGLGFFIWNSYVGGAYDQIIVGMVSIGIAGYACSAALRWLGTRVTPWLRRR
jgi:NitT/TauT family transport system permease protein